MKPQSSKPEKQTGFTWSEVRLTVNEPTPHEHYFEWRDGECRCKVCSFGLFGVVDIKDGKPV